MKTWSGSGALMSRKTRLVACFPGGGEWGGFSRGGRSIGAVPTGQGSLSSSSTCSWSPQVKLTKEQRRTHPISRWPTIFITDKHAWLENQRHEDTGWLCFSGLNLKSSFRMSEPLSWAWLHVGHTGTWKGSWQRVIPWLSLAWPNHGPPDDPPYLWCYCLFSILEYTFYEAGTFAVFPRLDQCLPYGGHWISVELIPDPWRWGGGCIKRESQCRPWTRDPFSPSLRESISLGLTTSQKLTLDPSDSFPSVPAQMSLSRWP